MKVLNFSIAVFSVIFGFFGVIAGMILPACERIAAFGITVRQRIRVVGIAVGMILMVGVTASALASRNHPPEPSDTVTIRQLNAFDSAESFTYRRGDSPFDITETLYRDNYDTPQVIVTSLQYARIGTWVDGNFSVTREYKNEPLLDNVRVPPTRDSGIGWATYEVEGDWTYKNVLYYPDGELRVNFNLGTFSGRFSADGDDANRVNHFGPGAMLPDGSGGMRHVNAGDKFVVDVAGHLSYSSDNPYFQHDGLVDVPNGLNVVEASGFFSDIRTGVKSGSGFYGRFYDATYYDNTKAPPAEVAGRIHDLMDRNGLETEGAYFGKREVFLLPTATDTVILGSLNEFDPRAAAPASDFRKGGGFYPIAEKEYRDTDSPRNLEVVVQSLQYANLGVWVDGDASAVGHFEYTTLANNVVLPPTISAGDSKATYIIEGDAIYRGARFYPDGHLEADFDNATIGGQMSISGKDATDDFGPNARIPDDDNPRGRSVNDDDILVMDLSGAIKRNGNFGFSGTEISVVEASGYFARFPAGQQRPGGFDGRFYDVRPSTDAPAELAGKFGVLDSNFVGLRGGFLGTQRVPLPALSDSVTLDNLEEYDSAPTILLPDDTRAGGDGDESHPTQQILSIKGKRFNNISDDSPQVLVQMLEHAYLGVWMYGDPSAVGNFAYQPLADNVVTPPEEGTTVSNARYSIEGEAVYKGVRFYPDGALLANFNAGTIIGRIDADGLFDRDDDFGTNAVLPDSNGERLPDYRDAFAIVIRNGRIESGKFAANDAAIRGSGFFSDLSSPDYKGVISGFFHDNADDYDNGVSAPAELSGQFKVTDEKGELSLMQGGFLGKKE